MAVWFISKQKATNSQSCEPFITNFICFRKPNYTGILLKIIAFVYPVFPALLILYFLNTPDLQLYDFIPKASFTKPSGTF